MKRHPTGVLPSDRAAPKGKPMGGFGAEQLASIPKPSADEVWRARRYLEEHAPDLLGALGLATPTAHIVHHRSVACPVCGAAVGAMCQAPRKGGYSKGHAARRHLAAEKGFVDE